MAQAYNILKEGIKIAFLILGIFTGISCSSATSEKIVFTVNGRPVGLTEYEQQLDKHKMMVISDFQSRYHASYGTGFWTKSFHGEVPGELLKRKAKEAIVITSVKKEMAREMGLIQKTGYEDFLKELDSVNKARLKAVQTGKIIYGPITYQPEVYAGYSLSILENAMKEKMTAQGTPINQVASVYSVLVEKNIRNAKIKIYENVYQQIQIH